MVKVTKSKDCGNSPKNQIRDSKGPVNRSNESMQALEAEMRPSRYIVQGGFDAGEGACITYTLRRGLHEMAKRFKVGDHVTWNSEAGHVSGTIVAIHTADFDYKGYTHHASETDPQYEITSDRSDHVAVHKGGVLDYVRKA